MSIYAWAFILFLLPGFLSAKDFIISARVVNNHTIRVDFKIPVDMKGTELILYRSTAKLTGSNINKVRYPITEFRIDSEQNPTTFFDHYTAHNVKYHYLAFIRQKGQKDILANSNAIEISIPDVTIEELTDPVILINKRYYYLEIQNKGKTAKRYPISLGRDPFKRKIHQDNKTTPEGLYKIINLQTEATFYKAIDIDYPNASDRIRYDFLRTEGLVSEDRGIGGEIQIHGKHPRFGSIQRNWTWGCISLRNIDIDEIFNLPALKVGIPVIIFGHEFSIEDAISMDEERPLDEIKSAQKKLTEMGLYKGKIDGILGRQTQFAIGRYQKDQNLPISCVLDGRTMDLLLRENVAHLAGIEPTAY
jgi:lipoprotein-anchoring transpeptidase ErfK/SrfK